MLVPFVSASSKIKKLCPSMFICKNSFFTIHWFLKTNVFVRTMSKSEPLVSSSFASVVNKSPSFGGTNAVSRDLRLIFVLNLRIWRSNLSTTKSILAYRSGEVSSARRTRNGKGIVTSTFAVFLYKLSN